MTGAIADAGANSSFPPPPDIDAFVRKLTIDGIVYFAGTAAERRALRGSAPGWRRHRSKLELRAHHEAAHGACGHVHNQFVHRLTIVEDPTVKLHGNLIAGGRAWLSATPEPPDFAHQQKHAFNDIHHACQIAATLALAEPGRFGWKLMLKVARRLRKQAETLVDACWYPLIVPLADALLVAETMDQEQIATILKPETRGIALPRL